MADNNELRESAAAARPVRRKHRRKKKKNRKKLLIAYALRLLCVLIVVGILAGVVALVGKLISGGKEKPQAPQTGEEVVIPKLTGMELPDFIQDASLPINPYSRPGHYTTKLDAIVFHSAEGRVIQAVELRDFYESLRTSALRRESSNFIVGADGTILMCVPPGEIAYASDSRDLDSVSITYCSLADNGEVSEEARAAMVMLTCWLCKEYNIPVENLLRHYDVSGKTCPAYFLSNKKLWTGFTESVKAAMEEEGSAAVPTEIAEDTESEPGSEEMESMVPSEEEQETN